MALLELIPLVLIMVAAFKAAGAAKSSPRRPSKAKIVLLWVLMIGVPLILQGLAANVFCPPFKVTQFHWALYDSGIPMREANYIVDCLWRTVGAAVGLVVAYAVWLAVLVNQPVKPEGNV